jgi:hypothetical protein
VEEFKAKSGSSVILNFRQSIYNNGIFAVLANISKDLKFRLIEERGSDDQKYVHSVSINGDQVINTRWGCYLKGLESKVKVTNARLYRLDGRELRTEIYGDGIMVAVRNVSSLMTIYKTIKFPEITDLILYTPVKINLD